jgi:hypothetical protein
MGLRGLPVLGWVAEAQRRNAMHGKYREGQGKPPLGAYSGRGTSPAGRSARAADRATQPTGRTVPISEVLERLRRAAAAHDNDVTGNQRSS